MSEVNILTINLEKFAEMLDHHDGPEPFEGWDTAKGDMRTESMGGLGEGAPAYGIDGFPVEPLVSNALVEPGSREQELAQKLNRFLVRVIKDARTKLKEREND